MHIATLGLMTLAAAPSAGADARFEDDLRRALRQCRVVVDTAEKLACYDRVVDRLSTPTFQGRLTLQTEPFEIDRPSRLRYESDGVIFVMYLKDAQGQVVQNLHIGGAGEDVYLIEKPGLYSLQINGAETWRIWIEPLR